MQEANELHNSGTAISQSEGKVSSGVILTFTIVRTDFIDSLAECQAPAPIVFVKRMGTDPSSKKENLKNACIIDFISHPEYISFPCENGDVRE